MNTKQLVERIKKQLSSLLSKEEVKFAQIQAGEMTITTPDEEFTIGSEVYTMDKDGNNIPLADGEYKADDGTMMMVVAGKITEIKKEMGEKEKPEVEVSIESQTQEMAETEMGKCNCEERMGKIETMMGDLMQKYEEMKNEKAQMMEKFSKIAEQPNSQPIKVQETAFSSIETKKSNSDAPDIMAIREKLRKNR
jgi:hypothetical protein